MATEEFSHVAEDILEHHEKWDGTGYPQGLKESDISLLARIVAIADAYEVMSNSRPCKKARNHYFPQILKEYTKADIKKRFFLFSHIDSGHYSQDCNMDGVGEGIIIYASNIR